MRQDKPGLLIIFLLINYPVQTDSPALQARESGVPDLDAVTASPMRGCDDVEADEAEGSPIFHHRDRRNRLVSEQADKEALWVCCIKAIRIVQTRIPPFRGRPIYSQAHFLAVHRSDLVCTFGHAIRSVS